MFFHMILWTEIDFVLNPLFLWKILSQLQDEGCMKLAEMANSFCRFHTKLNKNNTIDLFMSNLWNLSCQSRILSQTNKNMRHYKFSGLLITFVYVVHADVGQNDIQV